MNDLYLYGLFALPFLLWAVFLFYGLRKRSKLSKKEIIKFQEELSRIARKTPSERIVFYDKILDHILKKLGYGGTLWEKLKKRPTILADRIEEVWKLHKIRNRIVHEMEKVNDIEQHADQYESILESLLQKR